MTPSLTADEPRIATFARMRSEVSVVFRGRSAYTECKSPVYIYSLSSIYLYPGRGEGSEGVSLEGETVWTRHRGNVCEDELLQRSDGRAGSRAAAVRSGDGRRTARLAAASCGFTILYETNWGSPENTRVLYWGLIRFFFHKTQIDW